MNWHFPRNFLIEVLEMYIEVFVVYVGLFQEFSNAFCKTERCSVSLT